MIPVVCMLYHFQFVFECDFKCLFVSFNIRCQVPKFVFKFIQTMKACEAMDSK